MSPAKYSLGLILILCAPAAPVAADTIKLRGGGIVRGQILDNKSTTTSLVVKLQIGGGEIKVDRSKVLQIVREKNPLDEYQEIKDQYAQTPEDQFKLATWCEQHKLSRQRREHLLKVIELDPDHPQARTKLGYVRRDGKWLTRREIKEAEGLIRYQGRYVTSQQKAILERKRQKTEAIREWHKRIRLWKAALMGDDIAQSGRAQQKLLKLEDPHVVPAIMRQFGEEKSEKLRTLMCDILGNVPGDEAKVELVKRCIVDVSLNVRHLAAEKLRDREGLEAVKMLTGALQSDNRVIIRRAAAALGTIGDRSAVRPLIAALVTKHKKLRSRGLQFFAGATNVAGSTAEVADFEAIVAPGVIVFRPIVRYRTTGAGIGFPGREVVEVSVENPEVLQALEEITKENFGYNENRWKQWYQTELRREQIRVERRIQRR